MTEINRSYVSNLRFAISIARLPNTTFDIQSVNIPGVTLGRAIKPTPFIKKQWPGDHVDYAELDVTFKVDEKFNNWYEVHKWLTGQGFPRNFHEYASLKQGTDKNLQGESIVPELKKETRRSVGNIFSQVTLSVLTSHNNPLILFDFIDAYPVALSNMELKTTETEEEFLTCAITFVYDYYNVKLP